MSISSGLLVIAAVLCLSLPARAQSSGSTGAHDPVWDGGLKGAIWGTVVAVGGLTAAWATNNAPHGCNDDCVPIVAGAVGAGFAIGVGIDALCSQRVSVYHPNPASQAFPGKIRSDRWIGIGMRWRF